MSAFGIIPAMLAYFQAYAYRVHIGWPIICICLALAAAIAALIWWLKR